MKYVQYRDGFVEKCSDKDAKFALKSNGGMITTKKVYDNYLKENDVIACTKMLKKIYKATKF